MPLDKVITADDKRVRLPWWGVLCVMLGALLLYLLFIYFGRFDLARPSVISAGMVAITVALRWEFRGHLWFWVTMMLLAALHLPLIVFVPWTTKWIPAVLVAPVGIADLYVMLWVLSIVRRFMQGSDRSVA